MLTSLKGTTRVQYSGAVNKTITFDTLDSNYIIKNIDGLGAIKADITTTNLAVDPGGMYMSSRQGMRNIVITVGFNPTYSASESITSLRTKLYEVFMPRNKVELEFLMDSGKTYFIAGFVESHESSIFSVEPVAQISIICPEPYFTIPADAPVVIVINPTTTFTVTHAGLVPVGVLFEFDYKIAWNGSDTSVTLQKSSYGPEAKVQLAYTFDKALGDHWMFNTVKGSRDVTYTRSAVTNSGMFNFQGSLVDFKLYPGANRFVGAGFNTNIVQNAQMTYQMTYGGL